MLSFQAHFLLEVWVVTKQCPPESNNAGIISSGSPPHLFLYHSRDFACQRLSFKLPKALFFIFNLTSFQDWRELLSKWLWRVSLRAFSCASHQARVTVIRSALYWCMHVCVACIPSQRGPVHMWGGHGLIMCADEKNSMPFVLEKQRLLWIHYFMVACQGVSCSWLRESRLWGLIKPNSCWFVLVEQSEGDREGLELWKGGKKVRLEICKELRKVICSLGPAAHRLWRMH